MLGAACLASLGAMRAGAGMVTAAVPRGLNLALQTKIAHVVMTRPVSQTASMSFSLPAAAELLRGIGQFSAVVLGPGVGRHSSTVSFVRRMVMDCPLPMVVDADGLNALAGHTRSLDQAKGPRILTPHAGEMARISSERAKGDKERKSLALGFAREHGVILVLKGSRTVVAAPDGRSYINTTGNPGMSTAGSGDVLSGMIAAFLAQGLSPFDAARWAVGLHGTAGDAAARSFGRTSMIATDILSSLKIG
jgi:NAD(P)H-hydrate epimerase